MDAQQTRLFTSILVVAFIVGGIIVYFIISMVQQQRRNLRLYRQSILSEITAMEQERARIAADLHDELGPMLSGVKLRISSFELDDPNDREQLEKTCAHIDGLIQRIREISYDLLPTTLTRKGFVYAVRAFVDYVSAGAPLQIEISAPDAVKVKEQVAIHLYRIVQEVVHNAIKHSGASSLHIEVQQKGDTLLLWASDNGTGFDHHRLSRDSRGLGLRNLLNRTEMIGGKMFVESGQNRGTQYTFEVPHKP